MQLIHSAEANEPPVNDCAIDLSAAAAGRSETPKLGWCASVWEHRRRLLTLCILMALNIVRPETPDHSCSPVPARSAWCRSGYFSCRSGMPIQVFWGVYEQQGNSLQARHPPWHI